MEDVKWPTWVEPVDLIRKRVRFRDGTSAVICLLGAAPAYRFAETCGKSQAADMVISLCCESVQEWDVKTIDGKPAGNPKDPQSWEMVPKHIVPRIAKAANLLNFGEGVDGLGGFQFGDDEDEKKPDQ